MNRRTLLKSAAVLPLASCSNNLITPTATGRNRSLRFAYMGDTHINGETKPMQGVAKCFHHIQSHADKPDFILHGGDVIMDALVVTRDAVKKQWDAWETVVKADNSIPIEHCIGNHDVWGFDGAKTDPLSGKKWAIDEMQISGRYRSFDRNGWHFIILDSVQLRPDGKWYTGYIDPEQLDWLKQDLAKTEPHTPILLMSHIPIFTPTIFFDNRYINSTNWNIPAAMLMSNTPDLLKLFYQYPNIKAALSGHVHLLDRVDYNGITYLCNGSVCGSWWQSDTYQQTKAGYALIDLYDDGTVERTYLHYA